VLFGPNGCGKSTLLDIIAGRLSADRGVVRRAPGATLGYVFQQYADTLLPWCSAQRNIEIVLGGAPAASVRAHAALCRVGLDAVAGHYPYALSGGQQQLLAIARALELRPDILLLDEPFASVDYLGALRLAATTRERWREAGLAVLCVTHDPDAALLLGDRVHVLSPRPARIVDTITVAVDDPRTPSLVGTPTMAALRARLVDAVAGASRV
jgi:NitT/TauT family transport system ATP-binding protein